MRSVLTEEGRPLALFETYMALIQDAVDSRQYQRLFVRSHEGLTDVMDAGNFSCAYFVSAILHLSGLSFGGVHTTVIETIRDMERSDWEKIERLRPGAVIIWGEAGICSDGQTHQHIGFSIGNEQAISNHPVERVPRAHHVTFGKELGQPVRPIQAIYFHRSLRGW